MEKKSSSVNPRNKEYEIFYKKMLDISYLIFFGIEFL